jgi:ABC-type multidrug transport system fused ATPase/permease subunit
MDPETDKLLQNSIFEYTRDKVLLVITHRLENIHEYDYIYVMDNGQIIESGTHEDLKKIPNGFFRKQYDEYKL